MTIGSSWVGNRDIYAINRFHSPGNITQRGSIEIYYSILPGENIRDRVDLLELMDGESQRQTRLDLSPIVSDAGLTKDAPQFCTDLRNEPFDKGELAEQMVAAALPAIARWLSSVL